MQEGVAERDPGELGVQLERPAGWGRMEARPSLQRVGHGHGSAQLEARGALDGVQELAPQQRLILELGELQQVHAGAGGGQPLQVGAPVVDAECGVQLLKPQERGPGAAGHKLEEFALLLVREALHDSPEDLDHGVLGRVAS